MIAFNQRSFQRSTRRIPMPEFPAEPGILDTRIINPGVGAVSRLNPASAETLRRSREARDARTEKELSAKQKIWVAEHVTLRGYYQHFLEPERRKRLARGKISANTLQKDRQALNRWERHTKPDDWPARGPRWEGLVIGAIDEDDLADFFLRAKSQPLSSETVRSTWNHLRIIFNHAWHRGVLTDHLTPEAIERETGVVRIYSDEQIEAAYYAFDDRMDLQVAFTIAICCGPRTEDVFGLRWEGIDLLARGGPLLRFTARKTGKEHAIPLPEVAVRHIGRLPRADDCLFAGLVGSFRIGYRPEVLFVSRRSLTQLQKSRTATNATGAPAPTPTEYEGIPLIPTDSITTTEAIVS